MHKCLLKSSAFFSVFWVYIFRSGISWSYGNSMFSVLRNCCCEYFLLQLHCFTFLLNNGQGLNFFHIHANAFCFLLFLFVFCNIYPCRYKMISHCDFDGSVGFFLSDLQELFYLKNSSCVYYKYVPNLCLLILHLQCLV